MGKFSAGAACPADKKRKFIKADGVKTGLVWKPRPAEVGARLGRGDDYLFGVDTQTHALCCFVLLCVVWCCVVLRLLSQMCFSLLCVFCLSSSAPASFDLVLFLGGCVALLVLVIVLDLHVCSPLILFLV